MFYDLNPSLSSWYFCLICSTISILPSVLGFFVRYVLRSPSFSQFLVLLFDTFYDLNLSLSYWYFCSIRSTISILPSVLGIFVRYVLRCQSFPQFLVLLFDTFDDLNLSLSYWYFCSIRSTISILPLVLGTFGRYNLRSQSFPQYLVLLVDMFYDLNPSLSFWYFCSICLTMCPCLSSPPFPCSSSPSSVRLSSSVVNSPRYRTPSICLAVISVHVYVRVSLSTSPFRSANNESSEGLDILLPVTFYFNPSTGLDNVKNF